MNQPIYINGISTISALGRDAETPETSGWNTYKSGKSKLQIREVSGQPTYVGALSKTDRNAIEKLRLSNKLYEHLDGSVLMAMYCARQFQLNNKSNLGVNIGSSRGATGLFEAYHKEFLETGQSSTLSSPTTTLGNISSWVAQDLQSKGPNFSHSITCSTAFHSILNGIAWLEAGMADEFIVGGSEAPLTPFTIAQMKAMKIYADSNSEGEFPNQSLNLQKTKNTMILGEGAGLIRISKQASETSVGKIIGIGYATEELKHSASISADAKCIQDAMTMALKNHKLEDIDVVICHAPGTIKGDRAEVNAIQNVFGNHQPAITSNKWQLGHTFGASGMLSLEMALLMLKYQEFIGIPYLVEQIQPKKIENILINTVGFGGNAVSVLVGSRQ